MEKTIATYLIDGHKVDIVACSDEENAEGEVEFYDFWKRENDPPGEEFDTHLNLGDPWYPETGEGTPPTVEEVAGYLRSQLPIMFPGKGTAEVYETERTYRVVMLVTVTDEKKDDNDRGELDDGEYVSAEVQWVDTSFAGMEIVSLEKVPPPVDCKGKSSLETARNTLDSESQWAVGDIAMCMSRFIQAIDPEGFAAYVAIAAKERAS